MALQSTQKQHFYNYKLWLLYELMELESKTETSVMTETRHNELWNSLSFPDPSHASSRFRMAIGSNEKCLLLIETFGNKQDIMKASKHQILKVFLNVNSIRCDPTCLHMVWMLILSSNLLRVTIVMKYLGTDIRISNYH